LSASLTPRMLGSTTSHSTSPPTGGKHFLLHLLHRSIQEKNTDGCYFYCYNNSCEQEQTNLPDYSIPKMLESTTFCSLPLLFLRFCEITYPDMFSYLEVRTYDEQKKTVFICQCTWAKLTGSTLALHAVFTLSDVTTLSSTMCPYLEILTVPTMMALTLRILTTLS
jgi:hypothetical protein